LKDQEVLATRERGDFRSFRFIEHSSRFGIPSGLISVGCVAGLWGKDVRNQTLRLGVHGKVQNSTVPSDLTKVDFYQNLRLVRTSLQGICYRVGSQFSSALN